MKPVTSSDDFRLSLFLGEAWAAASQGDPKHIRKLFETLNVGSPTTDLLPRETLTVSPKPKTAALCFDRVWGSNPEIPERIRFWWGSLLESYTAASVVSFPSARKRGLYSSFVSREGLGSLDLRSPEERDKADENIDPGPVSLETLAEITDKFMTNYVTTWLSQFDRDLKKNIHGVKPGELFSLNEQFVKRSIMRFQLAAVWNVSKRVATPLFQEEVDFAAEYKEGNYQVLSAILKDVALVDEESLQWKQVVDFRSDAESREKYRRFIYWLDKDCIGKSVNFIQNAIGVKLSDYEAALKKHGVETKMGLLSTVIDKSSLIAAAASAAVVTQLTSDPFWTIMGAVAPIFGHIVLQIAKSKIDLEQITRGPNSEVAFIHEVQHL